MRDGRLQNAVTWGLIAAVAVVDILWIALAGFQLDAAGALEPVGATVVLAAAIWYYRVHRSEERIAGTLAAVLQLILYTAVAAPLSYLCATVGLPLWDTTFHGWDLAFGLDWSAYLSWTNERPLLGLAFKLAYSSLIPQMIVICVALGFSGKFLELRVFVLAAVLSGLLSIVISAAMPAVAMYVHLGLQPADFANLSPSAAYVHLRDIEGLRDGSLKALNLSAMEGIITFPSYHAALGVIMMAALFTVPYLRWPGAALNLTLIAATPIDGGHYFVDLGAGIGIAVLCLLAARSLHRPSWRSATMAPRVVGA